MLPVNNQLTMSSREIAELTNKRHDSVKRSMDRMSESAVISFTPTVEPTKGGGKPVTIYNVNKRDSYVVVAQLSPEFTARLVDRWQELEDKQTPTWMLQLSPEAKIAIEDLSSQLSIANDEVDRLQGVCNTITAQFAKGMTPPAFCKQMNGVNIQQVNNSLVNIGALIETKYGKEPASYYRDRYFKVSYKEYEKPDETTGQKATVTLTLAGAKWMYRLYLSSKLPMKKSWDGNFVHVEFKD